jgi:hypothetical protein
MAMFISKRMLARRIFIVLISGLSFVQSYGQSDSTSEAFIKSRFKPFIVPLEPERHDLKTLYASPFREIQVIDSRSDTSRIGFSYSRNIGHRQLVLQPTAGTEISAFLNSFSNPAASRSLLVVVKHLWISEMTPEEPEQPFQGKPHTTRLRFRAEAYLKDGTGYVPYGYLDTTVTAALQVLQVTPFRLPDLLTSFMKKMITLDPEKVLSTKRRVSFAFIDSFNKRKYSHRILKVDALRKGVYASLDDFRNNNPTINNYAVEQEGETLSLYLQDEEGKSYFTRKIWGYCDGQTSYVMINGNLYPVMRQQNAHYVFGAKHYTIKTTRIPIITLSAGLVGSVPVSQKVLMKLRMFTLDLDTGAID